MDEAFVIDGELRATIVDYLRQQPWGEVNNLIVPLMRAKGLPLPSGSGEDETDQVEPGNVDE